jgi:hypothetical protein
MVNYKLTMRDQAPDENGRKNTHRFTIRAKGRMDAITKALRDHPDWALVGIEAQDGSE